MMTTRLAVYMPKQTDNVYSTGITTYVPYLEGRAIAAERRKFYGTSIMEVKEDFADYRAEFYVYWQHKIEEHWRVVDKETGIKYEVKTVFPDRRNNLRKLYCERVNT